MPTPHPTCVPNGKRIARLYFSDGTIVAATPLAGKTLEWFKDKMDTRGECWILAKENGVEFARYNVRYVEAIIWEKPKHAEGSQARPQGSEPKINSKKARHR